MLSLWLWYSCHHLIELEWGTSDSSFQCHKRSFRSRISMLQKGRCLLASKFSSLMIAAGTINALKIVWPSALHILCQWHTLNAVWRFCNNGNNGIKKPDWPDWPILLRLFRRMVYAETKEKYDELYQDLLSDSTAKKYPKFVCHLERQYFTRSEKFTKYFRMENNLPLHGVNTSNITEALKTSLLTALMLVSFN